jgi:ribonuclease HI
MTNRAIIFCDGACKGNPGPGGFAAKIYYLDKDPKIVIGRESNTTNNRMELRAAIEGIKNVTLEIDTIEVNTDSQYLKKGITEWIHSWKKNGWKTANRKPVKNQDLWKELDLLSSHISIEWKWVPAHSGIPENEEVDTLASECCYNG